MFRIFGVHNTHSVFLFQVFRVTHRQALKNTTPIEVMEAWLHLLISREERKHIYVLYRANLRSQPPAPQSHLHDAWVSCGDDYDRQHSHPRSRRFESVDEHEFYYYRLGGMERIEQAQMAF
jgi:hypothetical protein